MVLERKDICAFLPLLKDVLRIILVTENRRKLLLSVHKTCNRDCFDCVPEQQKFTLLITELISVIQKFEVTIACESILRFTELLYAQQLINSARDLHDDFLNVVKKYKGRFCSER